jgi:hypothetical protein
MLSLQEKPAKWPVFLQVRHAWVIDSVSGHGYRDRSNAAKDQPVLDRRRSIYM